MKMATFVHSTPTIGTFRTLEAHRCSKRPRADYPATGRHKILMAARVNKPDDGSKSGGSGRPGQSTYGANEDVTSLQDEIRLLLDPSMPPGVKQVLIQDFAKRFFGTLSESNGSKTLCKELGLDGVADVVRQFQEDILPDLLFNGPRYIAKAVEEFPNRVSSLTSNTESAPWRNMPTSFEPEDVQREFRNIFNKTPEGLFTPSYKVLAKYDDYEIRQYPALIIAETPMNPDASSSATATEVENASAMGQSFTNLAGFLFGKNESKTAMKMTTPVILSKGEPQETMSFIIGEYESVDDVPKSLDENVTLREQEGQIFAVSEFSGYVTQGEAKRQREKLLSMLSRDGISLSEGGQGSYKCMVYNGPSTLPSLRRNEMMIEVVFSAEEVSEEEK